MGAYDGVGPNVLDAGIQNPNHFLLLAHKSCSSRFPRLFLDHDLRVMYNLRTLLQNFEVVVVEFKWLARVVKDELFEVFAEGQVTEFDLVEVD